jgi:tRNA(Arg) A34 adenosine deaminase TadA
MDEATTDDHWMRLAIADTRAGIIQGQGPFGACIVRAGRLVVVAHNITHATGDPTAHAEVTAIRNACTAVGTLDLRGCTLYSTCEPCPMCFAAGHWADLDQIIYGAGINDAVAFGFRELVIPAADMARLGGSRIRLRGGVCRDEAIELFRLYAKTVQPGS